MIIRTQSKYNTCRNFFESYDQRRTGEEKFRGGQKISEQTVLCFSFHIQFGTGLCDIRQQSEAQKSECQYRQNPPADIRKVQEKQFFLHTVSHLFASVHRILRSDRRIIGQDKIHKAIGIRPIHKNSDISYAPNKEKQQRQRKFVAIVIEILKKLLKVFRHNEFFGAEYDAVYGKVERNIKRDIE